MGPGHGLWSGPASLLGSASLTVLFPFGTSKPNPRSETRTDRYPYPCGRNVEGIPLALGVPAPTCASTRPPPLLLCPPSDQMIPLDESSGPRVYGVALGTGGRAKFPGSLFASSRWALLSAAVILLPLMGLFSAAR